MLASYLLVGNPPQRLNKKDRYRRPAHELIQHVHNVIRILNKLSRTFQYIYLISILNAYCSSKSLSNFILTTLFINYRKLKKSTLARAAIKNFFLIKHRNKSPKRRRTNFFSSIKLKWRNIKFKLKKLLAVPRARKSVVLVPQKQPLYFLIKIKVRPNFKVYRCRRKKDKIKLRSKQIS